MLALYHNDMSLCAQKVRVGLAEKGLDWENRHLVLRAGEHQQPWYIKLNRRAVVPTLIDGDNVVPESNVILEYLDEAYPEPPIIPKDIRSRAYVRAVSQIIGCEMHPLNNVRVLKHLKTQFGADEAATKAWYTHWITQGFRGLEDYLAQTRVHGRYCFGDSVTMADICLVPQVFNAARFDCPVDDYPIIKAIFERCMELDAVKSTQPNTQKDAF
jgi:maleylacetoacetate isomerase